MSEPASTRRDALRRGGLAAGALAAGGLLRPALAAAQSPDDEDLRDFLVEAIALEQVTVLAYARAAEAAESGGDRQQLEDFRDQEQAHANALRSAIDEIGFDPPEPPDSPADDGVFADVEGLDDDAAERLTDRLGEIDKARTPTEFSSLLRQLESEQITLYVGQGPALDSADLSTTSAEIAGCQAQHLYVLNVADGATPAQAADVVTKATQAAPPADTAQ